MTAGPARRILTPLPRNRPTPMAPPIAIIVSCLWLRRRRRPSPPECSSNSVIPADGGVGSVMTANAGAVTDEKADVLFEGFYNRVEVFHCVVHVKRYSEAVVPV